MRINGTDIRRYGAKQLTVEVQPPKMAAGYELFPKALLPVEYETDIPLGTMSVTIYFRERNRAALQRTMSSFMEQFGASCTIDEIGGYKGQSISDGWEIYKDAEAGKEDSGTVIRRIFLRRREGSHIRRKDIRKTVRRGKQEDAVHY